jgi:hypothetical protein
MAQPTTVAATDVELVGRARAGQLDAFETLTDRYERRAGLQQREPLTRALGGPERGLARTPHPGRALAARTPGPATRNLICGGGSVQHGHEAMKGEELLTMLNEYVDGSVDPAVCEASEEHMAGCNPCQVVVDNVRKATTLYPQGKPCELPAEFRQRLHSVLRQRWKETHAKTP